MGQFCNAVLINPLLVPYLVELSTRLSPMECLLLPQTWSFLAQSQHIGSLVVVIVSILGRRGIRAIRVIDNRCAPAGSILSRP